VTPGVVDNVDKETGNITIKPIPISPDKTVVGTQNGNVLIQDRSGRYIVSASELGGRLNDDGTVTIKDSEGKEKTLPHTGEEKGFLSIIGGTILSFVAFLFKKKK
ncbi:LPXTG cell wall anchor domain-containing protein, partial [Streptococcus uberis]